ncbi:MAG: YceI family protein [Spirosomataceae bacterium]
MKVVKLFVVVMLAAFVAVANDGGKATKKAVSYKVDTKASSFGWLGKKFSGEHNGAIQIQSGSLVVDGAKLTGGEFTIDMNSITCADLQGEYNGKLVGHLKSEDFFGSEKFPTSTFKITKAVAKSATAYDITGDLTIKGIKQSITFPATVSVDKSGKVSANAKFEVDRTKFGIKFKSKSLFSDLGDNFIYDNFTVDVKLVAGKGV